jgi:hypothetical protein
VKSASSKAENIMIEYRAAEGQYDRLPSLAANLVGRRVDVIFAYGGTGPAKAAKAATASIPIVFLSGADPVGAGIVSSLNRRGGNVTGVPLARLHADASGDGHLQVGHARGPQRPPWQSCIALGSGLACG